MIAQDEPACQEYRELSRRRFLQHSSALVAAMASLPAWLPTVTFGAGPSSGRDVLVNVFLRGGMDGLTTCVPYGDGELYNRRPTLGIRPPGSTDGAVDLDGFFGLAPAAAPLLVPFQAAHLAIVHATGLTDPTRSHFDAQKLMELGLPGSPAISSGWLARHLLSVGVLGAGFLRGAALASMVPRSLAGAPETLPLPNPGAFALPGRTATASLRRGALADMYVLAAEPLRSAAANTFATIDLLRQIDFAGYSPANGAVYPQTAFGRALRSAATLIKANAGVECIEADVGGWDFHNQEGPVSGGMAIRLDDLARSLAALHADLLAEIDGVTVIVMSEFGRRAGENASLGTDHGHGNCMLVLGGGIAGARVIAQWPGLAPASLDAGDLAITIDYRDVLAEVVANRLGNADSLDTVFPGYTPVFRGVTR